MVFLNFCDCVFWGGRNRQSLSFTTIQLPRICESAESLGPVLLRSWNPHIIGCRDLGIFYIGCDSHSLQTGLLLRVGLENQEVLVFEDLLQTIQIGLKAKEILRAESKILAARFVGYFGDSGLT
jgi:hypothetical protein